MGVRRTGRKVEEHWISFRTNAADRLHLANIRKGNPWLTTETALLRYALAVADPLWSEKVQ